MTGCKIPEPLFITWNSNRPVKSRSWRLWSDDVFALGRARREACQKTEQSKHSDNFSFMFFIQTSNIGEYRHFWILHFTLWNSPLSSNTGIWNRDKDFYRYFRDCYRYNFFKLKRSPTQNYVIWGALSSHSAGAVPLFIWADLALEAICTFVKVDTFSKNRARATVHNITHPSNLFSIFSATKTCQYLCLPIGGNGRQKVTKYVDWWRLGLSNTWGWGCHWDQPPYSHQRSKVPAGFPDL